jgi:uncharacterized protein (TIGR00730 family)
VASAGGDPAARARGAAKAGADRVRVAVFCGSSSHADPALLDLASQLGAEIARRGHTLIYGGGRTGLMGALANATLDEGGTVQGVILREFIEQDVHHLGLDELYAVDDMRSRKAGLDERADGFIALPGGLGTLEELTEILSFRKLAIHHRPVVLLSDGARGDFWRGLVAQIEQGIAEGLDAARVRDFFFQSGDPADAVGKLEAHARASS